MNGRVEIYLPYNEEHDVAEPLADFFVPHLETSIRKAEERHFKEAGEIIEIIVTAIGTWAGQKLLLEPLADRTREWKDALLESWARSRQKRPFHVVLHFSESADGLQEIEFLASTDLDMLEKTWVYIEDAHRAHALAFQSGITLRMIRILWDSSGDTLALGYENARPTYIVHLDTKRMEAIKGKSSTEKSYDEITNDLWVLEKLIEHANYLRAVKKQGYNIPTGQLKRAEIEIAQMKEKLRARQQRS